MGERHIRLWEWFEALRPGARPRARVEIWPRGGAKSSTAELGCARLAVTINRRFVLYVCATQEQADKHVQSIAQLLEESGVQRALGVYGTARGWRRSQLITDNGFNVAAYGLDVASRGVKVGQYRPDLIIFDDIDTHEDSLRIIDNKIEDITTGILPTGSTDCAVLFLQNMIHSESIVARLVDNRADFLHDREVPTVEPAVRDLKLVIEETDEGQKRFKIAGGEATWEGQDLTVCEQQIATWGYRAFMREAQHEVELTEGVFFHVRRINLLEPHEVLPEAGKIGKIVKKCRAWDLAATEGGGNTTVGFLLGLTDKGQVVGLHAAFGQWDSGRVFEEIRKHAEQDGCPYFCTLRLPQDPGQAGKSQKFDWGVRLARYKPVWKINSGSKAKRAERLQEEVNRENFYLVRGPWVVEIMEEWRLFREDEKDLKDDWVDAGADAVNHLLGPKRLAEVHRRPVEKRERHQFV